MYYTYTNSSGVELVLQEDIKAKYIVDQTKSPIMDGRHGV